VIQNKRLYVLLPDACLQHAESVIVVVVVYDLPIFSLNN